MARLSATRRLALVLGALFAALAIPSAVLLLETRKQIKFEAFYQYRSLADEVGLRIDNALQSVVATEEARGYADYRFLVLAGDPATSSVQQRSPLARFPVQSEVPGVIGYFQVGADGAFTTPAYPDDLADAARWGLSDAELAQRAALRDSLLNVLGKNALLERGAELPLSAQNALSKTLAKESANGPVGEAAKKRDSVVGALSDADAGKGAPTKALASQAAFDQLNSAANAAKSSGKDNVKVDDLRLDKNFQNEAPPAKEEFASGYELKAKSVAQTRAPRREQASVVDAQRQRSATRVRTFESELDPFEFSLLDDGHGVLFRKVWRDGQRIIQGAILDQKAFVDGAIVKPFQDTALAQVSDMVVAYRRDVVRVVAAPVGNAYLERSASQLRGELLHQLRLSAPFGDFQLLWNVRQLPVGPGGRVIAWAGAILFLLLMAGFVFLYRLGRRQILLGRQQQDFVSAVSHELNTPLASIRMYAEILAAGWASADKQREYYSFIQSESERLSRLIANVLQLARMERNERPLELKPQRLAALMDMLRSRLHSQVERAGFQIAYALDEADGEREVNVDADAFLQVLINLVDNALKFSAQAADKRIDVAVRVRGGRTAVWSVRDYGPGVEASQLRKIFQLFYRSGHELTRETPGTGIGLALVRQLARAMQGEADVIPRAPGAEFVLILPLIEAT